MQDGNTLCCVRGGKRPLFLALFFLQVVPRQDTHSGTSLFPELASLMSKVLWSKTKGALLPIAGFGIGWGAYNLALDGGLIPDECKRTINVNNLKLQLFLQRHVFPSSFLELYGYSNQLLEGMISSLEKGYTDEEISNRMTFDEILSECDLPEQLGYLEEHASEDIPYFYIADVFHSWASLNAASYTRQVGSGSNGTPLLQNNPDFDSEVLCTSLWDKMLTNVIPFDVSVRALCVLAVNNTRNAKRIATIGSPSEVLDKYEAYKTSVAASDTPRGDVISGAEVTAATLSLLLAMNAATVHRQWIPYVGRRSTGPYPLAQQVEQEQWCRCFSNSVLPADAVSLTPESALTLADVLCEKFKCNDCHPS